MLACNSLKNHGKVIKFLSEVESPVVTLHGRSTRSKKAMGIQKSEFPDLEGMEMDEELTEEEIQLKREEREDAGEWGFEKPEESYTEEWSEEDKQLRREEREAEEENDDWWFS